MSIVVIGTITRDTLYYPEKGSVQSLGGMVYETLTLASLADELIIPIANVGADIFDQVTALLSAYPNISLSGLNRIDQPNYQVFLCYFTEYGCELDQHLPPPISFKQVKPFTDASFFLIAFISGFELSLNTLRSIRQTVRCPIYLDYHSLAWGIDIENNRFLKRRNNWLDWVSVADFAQFNKLEARLQGRSPMETDSDLRMFGESILDRHGQAVIVTLGEVGSALVYRGQGRKYCFERIDAYHAGEAVDPAGCGAVYSASFISHYLKSGNISTACKFASKAAGVKATVSGTIGLGHILGEFKI